MRTSLVVTVAALLASGPGVAAAEPPTPTPAAGPVTIQGCGGTVTLTQVVLDERDRDLGHGQTLTTGRLVLRVTSSEGGSVVVNASGPAVTTLDTTAGTFTFAGTGQSLLFPTSDLDRAAAEAAGLPEVALTSGPVEILVHFDPQTGEHLSTDVVSRPHHVVDVCALLAASSG